MDVRERANGCLRKGFLPLSQFATVTQHWMALERCAFIDKTSSLSHPALWTTSTLLKASAWKAFRNHLNQSLARYNTGSLGHPILRIHVTSTLFNASAWEEALRNHSIRSVACSLYRQRIKRRIQNRLRLFSRSCINETESAVSDRVIKGTG